MKTRNKSWCAAVQLPIRNSAHARHMIATHLHGVIPVDQALKFAVNRKEFDFNGYVNFYMEEHPRGAKTAGSRRLRELYVACYTLKLASSRTKYYESRATSRQLTDRELTTLIKIPDLGTTDLAFAKGEPGELEDIRSLIDKGLLSGIYNIVGSLLEIWPTDDGIRIKPAAAATLAGRRIRRKIGKGKLTAPSETDYDAARQEIMSYAGHDSKTFIENARRVVAIFGDQ